MNNEHKYWNVGSIIFQWPTMLLLEDILMAKKEALKIEIDIKELKWTVRYSGDKSYEGWNNEELQAELDYLKACNV